MVRGSNIYDRAAIYPFLDGSALGARECNVDFDTEFHELGGLLCGPVRAVSSLLWMLNVTLATPSQLLEAIGTPPSYITI